MPVGSKRWLSEVDIGLYVLIVAFNVVSYIDTTSIVVELPIFVNRLSEGWSLPSKLVILAQTSKASVLCYAILKYVKKDRLKEMPFIYFVIVADIVGVLGIAFFWQTTLSIGGQDHSFALLLCIALLCFADGLVLVVCLPYMKRYKPQYTTAFFVGGGMCQIIPCLIGMAQGVGERPICVNETLNTYNITSGANYTIDKVTVSFPEPVFSVKVFFLITLGLILMSAVSFTLLHFVPYFYKKQTGTRPNNTEAMASTERNTEAIDLMLSQKNNATIERDTGAIDSMMLRKNNAATEITANNPKTTDVTDANYMGHRNLIFYLMTIALSQGLCYGFATSIQSYACLPYGNRAYILAIRLGLAINPVVSFLALFVYITSKAGVTLLNLGGTICAAYTLFLAIKSPFPPLKGTALGEVLVVSL